MTAKLIIETDGETLEYELPVDDSMILGIELEDIFHEHGMIEDDETLEIIDRIKAKMLHY
jgi:hypothetical protein